MSVLHCAHPWPTGHPAGRAARYDIERVHPQVDGATVRLWIDVPPASWKAFAT